MEVCVCVCAVQEVKVSEEMLMLLGDLLAVLASTDATRKLLLRQPSTAGHR